MENSKKVILVIDDDQKFVFALTTFLIRSGYRVLTAYDATYGMSLACKEELSLVVLDINLPAGGGLFVLENLRKMPKTTCLPVIISTANVTPGIEEKIRAMGVNEVLFKPYDLETLLEKIRASLP
ncbi:MAG: response regulator [Candidatus Omnitrophica bacterium]|nr:response regulator [Candidatus Omnitrophota bacterium]